MAEIAKCRMCGEQPAYRPLVKFWECVNSDCATCGPVDDPDGAKWNALMRGAPEPRAGRTGMNGLLKRALAEPKWVNDVVLGAEVMRTTGRAFCDADVARIGARVREIVEPTPTEPRVGTVRVRIPVWIDGFGEVSGIFSATRNEYDDEYQPSDGETRYIVVADIPIPSTTEIPGTVEATDE